MTKFVLDWVENIVGKRENTGYRHFLLFPQCFQKQTLSRLLKVVIVLCGKELMCNGKHPRTVCDVHICDTVDQWTDYTSGEV